jgi:hypothetical protein
MHSSAAVKAIASFRRSRIRYGARSRIAGPDTCVPTGLGHMSRLVAGGVARGHVVGRYSEALIGTIRVLGDA